MLNRTVYVFVYECICKHYVYAITKLRTKTGEHDEFESISIHTHIDRR